MKTKKKVAAEVLKLDLGCGQVAREGFTGVDLYCDSAIKCDLLKFPWPWADSSVSEVHSSHFYEHIPGKIRGKFMDELWRVLIPEGKVTIIVPYWSSMRSVQDFTHEWPPVAESSFLYFNKTWREQNKIDHYLCKCDFDFGYGYIADPETAGRNTESQSFWIKHYTNAISDLQVVLTKRA